VDGDEPNLYADGDHPYEAELPLPGTWRLIAGLLGEWSLYPLFFILILIGMGVAAVVATVFAEGSVQVFGIARFGAIYNLLWFGVTLGAWLALAQGAKEWARRTRGRSPTAGERAGRHTGAVQ
jgi:hypothetical protein